MGECRNLRANPKKIKISPDKVVLFRLQHDFIQVFTFCLKVPVRLNGQA